MIDESEMREMRRIAKSRRMTVAEWVRQALRAASSESPAQDASKKLAAVRSAVTNNFPAGDIEQMLAEIERGYGN